MSALDTLFVSAIVTLAAAVGALWRQNTLLNRQWQADQREASRLIFALMQRIAVFRGESPPATVSTPETPQFAEAKKLATRELNGEIEKLLKAYLDTIPPQPLRKR